MLFKSEEIDLENFDLAEAIVTEIVNKSSELSFENEMDRRKNLQKKKRKMTTDCDNPTTEKEIVYTK